MATNLNGLCIGQAQASMLVVTRLDATCTPLTGANDQGRTLCFAQVDATPQYDDGVEFGRRAASGARCWYLRDCDHLKQWDITVQLITWDMELLEIMTSSALILGSATSPWVGKVIGLETPGPDADCPSGLSLEVYVRAAALGSSGICSAAGAGFPTYVRHLFPFMRAKLGQVTLDDNADGIMANLSGFALPNPNWGNGPANNWEGAVGVGTDTPYAFAFSNTLPTSTCGYSPTVA